MRNLYYYRLDQAEEIIQTYSSWIGKPAHIGRGLKETLKAIKVQEKRAPRNLKGSQKLYRVEFEFTNEKKFSAHEFLFHNGLVPLELKQN
jgi:hypothetical protein